VCAKKAGDGTPEVWGYEHKRANKTSATRTRRYVGRAHAASNPENVIVPVSRPVKKTRISFNAYHVTTIRMAKKISSGIALTSDAPIVTTGVITSVNRPLPNSLVHGKSTNTLCKSA